LLPEKLEEPLFLREDVSPQQMKVLPSLTAKGFPCVITLENPDLEGTNDSK